MSADDTRHMAAALGLARRGLGRVWPNPAVGCVLVREGRVVGRGHTADGGRPHAETRALQMAGPAAEGATAYVTLEPCAHHGATPPCAEALVEAGIARAVVALRDPDRRVDGAGLARLTAAGIAVTEGVMEAAAAELQRGFLLRVTERRPMVTLKLAVSLDGRIATAGGESRWITGTAARRAVHAMRARHDAVLVGGGTARADDPALTVRNLGIDRQPVRVVFSRSADLPADGALARTAADAPVWICHGPETGGAARAEWEARGARLIEAPVEPGAGLDVRAALGRLADAGLTRVFCEGGGRLAASLLAADCVDDVVIFAAGLTLGADGVPAIGSLPESPLADFRRFRLVETRAIEDDVMQLWRR